MTTPATVLERWRPDPMTVAVAALILLGELAFVTAYLQVHGTLISDPVLAVGVPFVWLNLSFLVFAVVRPRSEAGSRRWLAAAIATGYFAVLAVAGGVLVFGNAGGSEVRVLWDRVPGWSPLVVVPGDPATLVVVPFKLVGYLALTYLVYVTVRDAPGALVGGVVGLLSCVSCTFPIVAGIVSSVAGGGAMAAAVYGNSYLLSTVVFAVTVGLLAWRPAVGSLQWLRPG